MKLQFDPNQQFQLDAVSAVVELFDGQPQGAPEFSVIRVGAMEGLLGGQKHFEALGFELKVAVTADEV